MTEGDPESTKKVEETVIEAKKSLSQFRQANLAALRRDTLAELRQDFAANCEKLATQEEKSEISRSFTTLEGQMSDPSSEFDRRAAALNSRFRNMCFERDDNLPRQVFEAWVARPFLFVDQGKFAELKSQGEAQISKKDIQGLRETIFEMQRLFPSGTGDAMTNEAASIARL
jgi:hypothetical protein